LRALAAGALYFTEYPGNRIGRMDPTGNLLAEYDVPTPDSVPIQIAAGPKRTIWFTENAANQIGRLRIPKGHHP
jgi:virginiamycin B lyase